MRAFHITDSFGLENLRPAALPDALPGPGQVRVRVRAVSLNYRDLLVIRGRYDPRFRLPLVPCSDAAGEVEAVGEGVTRVAVGDRVCPLFAPRWIAGRPTRERIRHTRGGPLPGVLREALITDAEAVVRAPAHLSFEEAATLPCAALTAWHALVAEGRLAAGERVLTLGTGGVSIFALQIARLMGARVAITSSSDQKLERAAAMGAELGLNYRDDPRWGKAARAWGPADHVVEVGGAGTLAQSLRAVRPGGSVHLIGVLARGEAPDLTPVLMQNLRIQGIFVGSREMFEDMNRALEAGGLRPVIDRVFPFGDAPAAFAHLASGAHFGKVVIAI